MDSKEQRQGGNGLLSSRQVVHGSEPLPWSHAVIVDAIQIRLLRVFWAQESLKKTRRHSPGKRFYLILQWKKSVHVLKEYLGTAVAWQGLVDLINVGGHRLKAGIKTIKSFLLDLLKGLLGLLCSLTSSLKLCRSNKKQNPLDHKCTVFLIV